MAGQSIAEKVEPLLMTVAETQGVTLYDLEYVKEGGDWILRLYIDREDGVGLNDCERVSRAAEAVLDERDPIPTAYILEVSSPGIERRLRKDAHFTRYMGEQVTLALFKPVNGRKKFRGKLANLRDGAVILIDESGEELCFERSLISVCRLAVF